MTQRKLPPRRLGFEPHPEQRASDVQLLARAKFLQLVRVEVPAVLAELAVAADTDEARQVWARRWALPDPWCLAAAAATQRMWATYPETRGRGWAPLSRAAWVDPTEARHPGTLKYPEHFGWLVQYQCARVPYLRLADAAALRVQTVRDGCTRLAALLGLTLRPTRRGRPRSR